MTTAVVIRAFNEEAHIGRLLTGIRHQTCEPDETIVVDSGSTDATASIAEAFGARIVGIARDEFSFGRALNRGIAAADADLVVIASAHVYPIFDDWLERLLAPLDDERVGLSYGRQTIPPEGRFSERRLLSQWFPRGSGHDPANPFCNNANAAVRRELWLAQPYDERLTGLEDLAWAKGIIERGFAVAYAAEAPVAHVHNEGFGEIVNRYRREAIAHSAIFPAQTFGAATAMRLCVSNILQDIRAAVGEGATPSQVVDIFSFRIAQFYGTLRGFQQNGPVTEELKRRFYYPPSQHAGSPSDQAQQGNRIDYDELSSPASWR